MVAEEVADGVGFERVADRSGSAVSIDVANISGLDSRISYRIFHHSEATFVLGRGLGDVVGVSAHAVADDFGDQLHSARAGVFEFFQNQDSRPFADHETVAVAVPRTAGLLRFVIAGGERAPVRKSYH